MEKPINTRKTGLNPAPRTRNGRCAATGDTIKRLESGLAKVCEFEYSETYAGDSLYWGAFHTKKLGFPPMGKGASPSQCKASTLAEAAEWLALLRRRDLPGYINAHQDDVPNTLSIESLLKHISASHPDFLSKIKNTELSRHWVDGFSIINEKEIKVPLEYIGGISGTNGVAAGNCIEEAIVQGAFEVIERRAVITVIRNRMSHPTIDCDSIEDKVAREQISFLREQGFEVFIKDLSFGGALPCIGAYVADPKVPYRFQSHHLFKAAASYDRAAALRSCLTEYAQVCHMGAENDAEEPYTRILCEDNPDNFLPLFWFGYVPYANADFLKQGDVVHFDPGEKLNDFLEDIHLIKGLFEKLDMDFIFVDLTDPEVGFPVVQVVIPGYSDIIPYHPANSPVLLRGWTRNLPMGNIQTGDSVAVCTAEGLFPEW